MAWTKRRLQRATSILICLVASAMSLAAVGAESVASKATSHKVATTFDDSPFEYQQVLRTQREGFNIYRLSYPSPIKTPHEANNTIPADYYLPTDMKPTAARRPAVICLHILNGRFELVDIICSALARRGIPAIMFKLPHYGERGSREARRRLASDPKMFARVVHQSFADVRRTVDVLASRSEVDPKRIGIAGISLGGIVAATAAGIEPRLNRAALILAGGDLMKIVGHARETRGLRNMLKRLPEAELAELNKQFQGIDPLHTAAALRERAMAGRVLMINASRDEVIPAECTKKLADSLGIADKVVWLEGLGHYTALAELARTVQLTTSFFAKDLPAGVQPHQAKKTEQTPLQTAAGLLKDITTLTNEQPPAGRCHMLALKVTAKEKSGKPIDAELQIIRGSGHQFKIAVRIAKLGGATLGQSKTPWMLAADKKVFQGKANESAAAGDPLAGADPKHLVKLRMVSGAATALSITPDLLSRWIEAKDITEKDGPRTIRFVPKKSTKATGDVRLVFRDDGKTPASAVFDVDGTRGTIEFRSWAINTVAHPALFEPPGGVPQQTVETEELHRMFSAMFNFAMGYTQ